VRVALDWDRLRAAQAEIDLVVVDAGASIADWAFPWYVDSQGAFVPCDDPDAHAILVGDAATVLRDPARAARIEALARTMPVERPTPLLLAAYLLPANRRLVLDGNHRLAAAVTRRLPFTALVLSVHGPLDPAICPDLRHWTPADDSA
jgi:hypothetical protein